MLSPKSAPKLKSSSPSAVWSFEAIGTAWSIELYKTLSKSKLRAIQAAVAERIEVYDAHYSRFRSDSLVTQWAQQAGDYTLPADAFPMLKFYQELYGLTDGAVTPLIGQVLSDAGYDAGYSLQPGPLSAPPRWEEVLTFTKTHLNLKQPALLDFGAAGKGYLVDIIGQLLREQGIGEFCIDASGDMLHKHKLESLRVGLENPDDPEQVIGVLELQNQALCGSASNRRRWAGFHHIMSPHSLHSPEHLKAVWVVAGETMLADGLTTALYFVPAEELRKRYTFEYTKVLANGQLEHSPGFKAEFFTS